MSGRDWRNAALCAQFPAEIFHNEGQGASAEEGKRVCRSCEVRAACLEETLRIEVDVEDVPHGVAGGLSAKERIVIIRGMRRAARGAAA